MVQRHLCFSNADPIGFMGVFFYFSGHLNVSTWNCDLHHPTDLQTANIIHTFMIRQWIWKLQIKYVSKYLFRLSECDKFTNPINCQSSDWMLKQMNVSDVERPYLIKQSTATSITWIVNLKQFWMESMRVSQTTTNLHQKSSLKNINQSTTMR